MGQNRGQIEGTIEGTAVWLLMVVNCVRVIAVVVDVDNARRPRCCCFQD